ncbi:MAG: hypothetical protein RL662_1518 [Bacteroidota bacterium]|jgi:nicotinamide mononucleotide transporter
MILDFFKQNWIEIIGAFVGLLYLYFEYKAHILMWATGIVMSIFYTYVFIYSTFYAFASINIYYILAGIYGWITWHRNKKEASITDIGIVQTPTRLYIPLIISSISIYAILVLVLSRYTDSQVVYGDSFVTSLSIVAMWMLAQKYVEQWLLLIVVNIVSVYLYAHQHLYPTSIMYLVYTITSVFGYFNWLKMIKNKNLT